MSPRETDNFNIGKPNAPEKRRSGSFERAKARYRDRDMAADYMNRTKPDRSGESETAAASGKRQGLIFETDFTGYDSSFREEMRRRRKSRISPVSTYSTELKDDMESPAEKMQKEKRKRFSAKKKKPIDNDIDTRSVKTISGFNQRSNKRRQIVRWLLSSALVLILLGGLAAIGLFAFDKLHVTQISITGSSAYTEEQLLALSNLQKGELIFNYKSADIIDSFSRIKGISVISVRKNLPDKLSIAVEDITPYAAIPAANGTYTLISVDGIVYSIGETDSMDFLTVEGLSSEGFICGTNIASTDSSVRESTAVAIISELIGTELENVVTAIDLSNSSCVKLKIGNVFTIVLGNCTEATGNIGTAEKAYSIFSKSHPSGGIINVFTDSTVVDFTPAVTDAPQQ